MRASRTFNRRLIASLVAILTLATLYAQAPSDDDSARLRQQIEQLKQENQPHRSRNESLTRGAGGIRTRPSTTSFSRGLSQPIIQSFRPMSLTIYLLLATLRSKIRSPAMALETSDHFRVAFS